MSNSVLGSYDSKRVDLSIGVNSVDGFGEGSKIVVSRANDMAVFTVGVDGDVVGNRENNETGTMTITLLAQSPWNTYLAEWAALTASSPERMWLPIVLRDPSTNVKLATAGALLTQPDVNFANTAADREWTFFLLSVNVSTLGQLSNAINLQQAVFN